MNVLELRWLDGKRTVEDILFYYSVGEE